MIDGPLPAMEASRQRTAKVRVSLSLHPTLVRSPIDFCERLSVERLAENRRLPHDFVAASPLRPSPLTGVDYPALRNEVLDCFLYCELNLGRICRPVFSSHNNIPSLVLSSRSFDCHPAPWFSLRSI
jgi:hypothetical protein